MHGYGEHLGRYDHLAGALVKAGAWVAGPDHQGHGLSDGDQVHITDYEIVVDDLHQVALTLQEEFPGIPLVVIGHSMGGMIATRYAQRHGKVLKALVLSGPLLGQRTAITNVLDLAEIPNTPLDTTMLSRDPCVGAAYSADPLVWHGPFKRPTLVAMTVMLNTIHAGPSLSDIPTLWMHGSEDQLVLVEETRSTLDRIKGSHFEAEIIEGARHEIFNEINKEDVLKRVTDFLRRII